MIELDHRHIDLIRFSTELSSAVAEYLDDPVQALVAAEAADYVTLHDACIGALMNDAPIGVAAASDSTTNAQSMK